MIGKILIIWLVGAFLAWLFVYAATKGRDDDE